MGHASKAIRRRAEAVARREPGYFIPLPCVVLRSEAFARVSAHAVKLLMDLLSQLKTQEQNGDMTAAWTTMVRRGWKSRDTLNKARKELESTGFIELTRQGGRHKCSLYAVTFFAIGYCDGKLDVSRTSSPRGDWHRGRTLLAPPTAPPLIVRARTTRKSDTPTVSKECSTGSIGGPPRSKRPAFDTATVPVRPDSLFALTRRACTF